VMTPTIPFCGTEAVNAANDIQPVDRLFWFSIGITIGLCWLTFLFLLVRKCK
jgi:hypothetical protein